MKLKILRIMVLKFVKIILTNLFIPKLLQLYKINKCILNYTSYDSLKKKNASQHFLWKDCYENYIKV